ncbi:MAG: hypothetical protein ACREUC_02095 [Steroidobacteraceae bacterium]
MRTQPIHVVVGCNADHVARQNGTRQTLRGEVHVREKAFVVEVFKGGRKLP